MAHVNNATYLDILDEAIAAETGSLTGPRPPVRYELEYLRPALPRTQVSVIRWVASGQTVAVFRVDDDELMRARLTLG
jgi:acyl-ACP thioesterase